VPGISIIIREMMNMALVPACFRIGKAFFPPTIAGLFLTNRCNSRCTICGYWKNTDLSDELTTGEWEQVLDELKKLGVKMINFTADGEILTRKDAFEIMRYAKRLGFAITINTNGLVMDQFIQHIIELKPLQMQISLDVFDDVGYEKIRGVPNGFTKVKNNILVLKHAGFNKISVGSVLTKDNLDDLTQLQKFCLEHGFAYRVTAFQFEGFGIDDTRRLRQTYREESFLEQLNEVVYELSKYPMNNTKQYLKSMIHYYTSDKYHPLNCVVAHYKIFIFPNGDVSLCNVMHSNAVTSNVKEKFLKDIWFSKQANVIRQQIKEKKCPSCWLSCFAEDNIRFSPVNFLKSAGYFWKKTMRLFK
jgi:MoaA/NifB/PqqE/SkfB family radical SAM enzyme